MGGVAVAAIAMASAMGSAGCAARQGGQQDFAALHEELARVQHDHDALAKRVGELENREESRRMDEDAVGSTASAGAVGGTSSSDGKPLKVVKLEPAAAAVTVEASSAMPVTTTDDDDGEPRPLLKSGPTGAIEESYPDDPPPGSKKVVKSKTATMDPKAAGEYDAALKLYKGKKYKEALDAFAGFVVRYPDHPYASNAFFWRGECYYALGEYSSAVGQFDALLAAYSASSKVPDALLQLGLSHRKLGSAVKAKAAFDRLRKEYPSSDAAKKIPSEDAP